MRIRRNKFHFTSLGCLRNLMDSEEMIAKLLRHGYEIVGEEELADYLVVNTYGFLASARQEALDRGDLPAEKVEAKAIVTGSMVQKKGDLIRSTFSDIHYLLGAREVEHIVGAARSGQGSVISSGRSYLAAGEIPAFRITPPRYAYTKIPEVCKKACAFCTIPDIKYPLRSKEEKRDLYEFQTLLQSGVEEIILIAQD